MAESTLDVILRAQRTGQIAYAAERADILDTKKAFLDAQVQQMEASKAAQKAVEAQAAGSANAYELQVKAAQKATAAQIATADAAKKARDQAVAANTESAGSFDLLGKSADAARLGLLAVAAIGIGGGAGIVEATKAAANFQQQLTLIHTQAGAVDENLGTINTALLQMAGDVGMGPTQLAEGLYHIESAGFRGAQALDMLRNAAQLADVGQADLQDTTQAVIGTMAAFATKGMTAADAVAQLNAIVGTGDMRMEQLDKAIATGILPTAATFGLSLKDVGAALATLTDNVTPADEAATRLRMTIALMGAPSGTARKALGSLGIDALQLADDMRKPDGLLVAITDLKDHLSHIDVSQVSGGLDTVKADLQSFGLTDDEIQTALSKLGPTGAEQADLIARAFGGGRSSAAIMTLLTEFDRFSSKYSQIDEQSKSFKSDWEAQQQTFNQSWNDFKAGLDAGAIALGQQFLPYATGFLNWLKDSLPNIQKTASVLGGDLVAAGKQVAQWLKDAAPLAQQFQREIGGNLSDALKRSEPELKILKQDLQDFGNLLVTTVKSEGFADFIAGLEVYVPAAVEVAIAAIATAVDEVKVITTALGGLGHVAYDLARGDWKAAWNDMQSTEQLQTQNMTQLSKDFQNENTAIAHATGQGLANEWQAARAQVLGITSGMYAQMDQDARQDMSNEEALANSIGAGIDQGMAAGISANAGLIHSAATAAIRDALAGVQNENIIASPSKKWADEVGLPLAQGVAMGLWQGAGAILAAAGGVTRPTAPTGPPVGSTGLGGIALPAAGSYVPPNSGGLGLDDTNELLAALYQLLDDRLQRPTGFTTAAFNARA